MECHSTVFHGIPRSSMKLNEHFSLSTKRSATSRNASAAPLRTLSRPNLHARPAQTFAMPIPLLMACCLGLTWARCAPPVPQNAKRTNPARNTRARIRVLQTNTSAIVKLQRCPAPRAAETIETSSYHNSPECIAKHQAPKTCIQDQAPSMQRPGAKKQLVVVFLVSFGLRNGHSGDPLAEAP